MPENSTYTIAADGKSITCHWCGRTSCHPKDVEHLFCPCCCVFHGEPSEERLREGIRTMLRSKLYAEALV